MIIESKSFNQSAEQTSFSTKKADYDSSPTAVLVVQGFISAINNTKPIVMSIYCILAEQELVNR